MENLKITLQSFLERLQSIDFANADPLLLLTFVLALLGLIASVRALRSIGRTGGDAKLAEAVETFGKKFAEFAKQSAEQTAILEARIASLESAGTTAGASAPTAQKKKPESPDLTKAAAASSTLAEEASKALAAAEALVQTAAEVREEQTVIDGLQKTRSQLFSGFSKLFSEQGALDEGRLRDLEELLITNDLGVNTAQSLVSRVRESVSTGAGIDADGLRSLLKHEVHAILSDDKPPAIEPRKRGDSPMVLLVVGVNGVGKTTSIGKLAYQFKQQGARVLIGACDTFRAAASEQLAEWAGRVGADIVMEPEGAKPSTVAYKAVHKAVDEGYDVLIIDTAGRLHTRVNLMNELGNVQGIIERELPGAPHETVLVLDASTGQNALQQAREFHDKVSLSGIIVTKLDGTPKGGIVVAIKNELGIPIRYIGVGESEYDLKLFSATEFTDALLSDEGVTLVPEGQVSAHAKVRRKRRRTLGEEGAVG